MQVSSNISDVLNGIASNLIGMKNDMLREVATSMLPVVKDRIHTDGKAADGTQIGTYSKGYMAVRTGVYQSNGKITKGKNKGETRNVGVFTKGKNKGEERPKYNRTSDTKVVASLTRQMESDFSVQATSEGYGLGFNNDENFNKSQYVEATYKKKIYGLTDTEKEQAVEVAGNYTNRKLNG